MLGVELIPMLIKNVIIAIGKKDAYVIKDRKDFKFMKKRSLIILCGVILLCLCGCNNNDYEPEEKETLNGIYEAGDFKIMLLNDSKCNYIFGYVEGYDDISVSTNNCNWYSVESNGETKVFISYTITTTTMYGQTYNKQVSGEWLYSDGALSNSDGGYYVKIQ